ncbi:hypothetical protein FN846DRAFT_894280 [Sphaerosporella brunnea]|uniref:Uncharacterized protein n=1 Tax=Sphaerosporella brunnea TaxID=1250544 RepID=A0A5J5EJC9_9PEZI|nr:hypothetical protein FN846DRAFT_894280 [Sphaerosporella brunnea]
MFPFSALLFGRSLDDVGEPVLQALHTTLHKADSGVQPACEVFKNLWRRPHNSGTMNIDTIQVARLSSSTPAKLLQPPWSWGLHPNAIETPIHHAALDKCSVPVQQMPRDFPRHCTAQTCAPGGKSEVEQKGESEGVESEDFADFSERIDAGWKSGFPRRKPVAVRERHILVNKVVGNAWEELRRQKADLTQRSFNGRGISLNPDGSEDELLK